MGSTTTLWNLPVWAVLLLAVIIGLTVFNTIDSITKIWREPKPPQPPRRGLYDIARERNNG